jgi:opacity protein-like surface antigen
MRLLVLCAATMISGSDAVAGWLDQSVLRGSSASDYTSQPAVQPRYVPGVPIHYRWEGLYMGGHFGYSNAGVDFGNGTQSLLNFLLRNDVVLNHVSNWTVLPKVENNKTIFGGFVGYNFQMSEIILGLEGNYSRVNSGGFDPSASDSMGRRFQDDAGAPAGHHYFYSTTLTAAASARLQDFGAIRARAGFALDRFMPYVFGGLALGRVDVSRSVTVSYLRHDVPNVVAPPGAPITPEPDFFFGPQTQAEIRESVVAYGYAAGLGLDVAVMPNVFMRGEWEYLQFNAVQDYKIRINTFRAGLGVKF